jgi:hypothetical protein
MRGGQAVEHIDLANVVDAKLSVSDELTKDITVERASIWRTKHHGVVMGLDFAVRGGSEDACRAILEQDHTESAPSSCAMTIRLDVTRINDDGVKIHGGRGSHGHLITT